MREATLNLPDQPSEEITRSEAGAMQLAVNVLFVGLICYFSTEIGFAHKFPPHYISPLWPTGAILFSVLVVTPVRHWWAYILAAYFSSVVNDVRAGLPVSAILFIVAGIMEVLLAAAGVRRFAGGLRAFASLRTLVIYILVAVMLAPGISAFVAAFAGTKVNYWFYWRVWFLSEALAHLMLAPAILTWLASARTPARHSSLSRSIEAGLIGCGLLAISLRVFIWPAAGENVPALVYLPLPLLLWAAVRFGPTGINTSLLVVAFLSISGVVRGHGPFIGSTPADAVLPLQLFLVTISVPLMLLAALIHERQDKEEALRESEERVTLAASAGKLGLWLWDVPRDEIWVGQGRRGLFGWTESEPINFRRFMETVHPEDRERVRAGVSQALQGGGDHVAEYRIVLSDGSMRWLVTRARIELDGDGRPARVRGVSIDIGERKRAEEALRESEARFRTVADHAPVMIWISGTDKLCTFFNKGWLDFTGRSIEQELGNGWTEGLHPNDFEKSLEVYADAFAARQDFTMEYRLRRFDGEYCWVLDHGVPRFESDGTFLGYIGTAIDITERKRSESELQRQRDDLAHMTRVSTMGELAGSLAHELNQPLTAILSNAQAAQRFLAADPPETHEVSDILKDIIQDDSRASEVIQRLRALVKKEELAFAPLDLTGVIREVVELVHSDAILHGVRIVLELDFGVQAVLGNRVQLQQVALNLLLNAFDAMRDAPMNEREVLVRIGSEVGNAARVSVRDCGSGLAADKLDNIFEPFFTTKRDGLGMGLSISRSIIEAHGGRLWAENNIERGATFYFTLPLRNG